jgi:hypothetical protein
VADLRVTKGTESFFRDFDRPGDEKFDVAVSGGVGRIEHD